MWSSPTILDCWKEKGSCNIHSPKTTTKVFSFVSSKFIISNLKQVIKKYKINTFYTFELEIKNKINKNL